MHQKQISTLSPPKTRLSSPHFYETFRWPLTPVQWKWGRHFSLNVNFHWHKRPTQTQTQPTSSSRTLDVVCHLLVTSRTACAWELETATHLYHICVSVSINQETWRWRQIHVSCGERKNNITFNSILTLSSFTWCIHLELILAKNLRAVLWFF